jgi:hypothetical protein
MNATAPPDAGPPLLARLPVAAGAVRLRALRTDDLDEVLACRSGREVVRHPGGEPMGMALLCGTTDERNAASLRRRSRLGFAQTLREAVMFRGERCIETTLERRP